MEAKICLMVFVLVVGQTMLYVSQAKSENEPTCSGKADERKLEPPPKQFNILLFGATGDLAKKYLWNGLFSLFRKHYKKGSTAFYIYACGTSKQDVGRQKLSEILLKVVRCDPDVSKDDCFSLKSEFVAITQYHQTKTEENYRNLADKIAENSQSLYGLQDTDRTSEDGRLVYLSIPPSQYTKATKLINKYLRPDLGRPWFKIVLEKPFGYDKESAVKLSKHLNSLFKEEEIYRIDHYLGKPVVKNILPFRLANRHLYEPVWNRQHIERVEVVMKETLDCKGRTSFYDEVGVIRDVMQNHLTEIMTLVAMELPDKDATITSILRKKQQVLENIIPLELSSTVVAQYETYATEVVIEQSNDSDINHKEHVKQSSTNTPTFAASVLFVNNARWKDVPFVLMSGKKLDEKSSYVRVIFKESKFCLGRNDPLCNATNQRGQMVFLIASNDVRLPPLISVSKHLLNNNNNGQSSCSNDEGDDCSNYNVPKATLGWKLAKWNLDAELIGEKLNRGYQLIADSQQADAYTNLIEAVYEGQRHLFTHTDCLLASWDIWSGLVKTVDKIGKEGNSLAQKQIRRYIGNGVDSHVLDFQIKGNRIEFVRRNEDLISVIENEADWNNGIKYSQHLNSIASEFRGHKLVVKARDKLIEQLALAIESSALNSVDERGVFHIALPGGTTPRPLLLYLAQHLPLFPWKQTHIWQVDERCVESSSKASNFRLIQDLVLNYINVPFHNIHPMPVHLLEDLCDSKYNGDLLYEAVLERNVLNSTLDWVVLGMGEDAHVASLFPNEDSLELSDNINHSNERKEDDNNKWQKQNKLIAFTQVKKSHLMITKRMTMTFPLINAARNVTILVTGKNKHSILQKISSVEKMSKDFPVTFVEPRNGDVTWYVDYDAYFP